MSNTYWQCIDKLCKGHLNIKYKEIIKGPSDHVANLSLCSGSKRSASWYHSIANRCSVGHCNECFKFEFSDIKCL